jgi:uncharacterized membrane protein YebE (DUF533 family)
MSLEIKQAEISELEVQNKKRNLITVTYAIFGAAVGYYVFMNTKSKKSNFYNYVIGGALAFGLGYQVLTMKKTKRRKEAIKKKTATLTQGDYKPAPALLDTGVVPTTVVDLGAPNPTTVNTPSVNPTNTSPKDPTMIYKN